ncbi:MAG TPA: hypothetical protein VFS40_15185 [Gemmatimonadales bacterium]|nr:hypothetical protein [Gemmatimonadales bacterium]
MCRPLTAVVLLIALSLDAAPARAQSRAPVLSPWRATRSSDLAPGVRLARRTCGDNRVAGAVLLGAVGLVLGPSLAGYADADNLSHGSFPLVALGSAAAGALLGGVLGAQIRQPCPAADSTDTGRR